MTRIAFTDPSARTILRLARPQRITAPFSSKPQRRRLQEVPPTRKAKVLRGFFSHSFCDKLNILFYHLIQFLSQIQ